RGGVAGIWRAVEREPLCLLQVLRERQRKGHRIFHLSALVGGSERQIVNDGVVAIGGIQLAVRESRQNTIGAGRAEGLSLCGRSFLLNLDARDFSTGCLMTYDQTQCGKHRAEEDSTTYASSAAVALDHIRLINCGE